jgi:hypothetical protein
MMIEKIEIPLTKTVATADGFWHEVATGETKVFYRASGPSETAKKRPRPRSRAREGRRDQRR